MYELVRVGSKISPLSMGRVGSGLQTFENGLNIVHAYSRCRSVAKPDDSKESKDAKKRQIRRQVSAIKTIMFVSGAYFILYFPMVIFRLVLYGTVSPIDIEIRRYPALTLAVRCSVLAMSTTTPFVNPILYLNTRKNLKKVCSLSHRGCVCLAAGEAIGSM
jgi:hypothetical protein